MLTISLGSFGFLLPLLATTDVSQREERITPEGITRLCPDHKGGDKEFKGHGPNVRASARLAIRSNGRQLWVVLDLHAKETKKDWTEAAGKWNRLLWTAPSGFEIEGIISDKRSETYYTDTNHGLDKPAVRGGSLVQKFEIMGDTKGNDVGNCTADDVYMNVYFNEVKLKLKKAN